MLSLIKSKLRLLRPPEFAIGCRHEKTLLGFSLTVNQGGLLFLRQAKGNNLNLRKKSKRISDS